MTAEMDELMALIGEARIVFWACSNQTHRFVTWRDTPDGKIPRCDTCGREGTPR